MERFLIFLSIVVGVFFIAILIAIFWATCRRKKVGLTDFQKAKLTYEFKTFFDIDGDGVIDWNDFELTKNFTCEINCWKPETEKYLACEKVFANIWDSLRAYADMDDDKHITLDEWLSMWEVLIRQIGQKADLSATFEERLPMWLYQYLIHRFNVLDRTGDGAIDAEEYEFAMSKFGIPCRESRKAFLIFSDNNTKRIDFEEFCELSLQYYFSNDPAAVGNFINAKLNFI